MVPVHFFEDLDKTIEFVVQKESVDQVEVAFVVVGVVNPPPQPVLPPGAGVRVGVEEEGVAAAVVAVEGERKPYCLCPALGRLLLLWEVKGARLARGHRPQLIWIRGHEACLELDLGSKNLLEENGRSLKVPVDVVLPFFPGCWVSCFQVGHQHRLLRPQRLHLGQEQPVYY